MLLRLIANLALKTAKRGRLDSFEKMYNDAVAQIQLVDAGLDEAFDHTSAVLEEIYKQRDAIITLKGRVARFKY